MVTLNRSFTDWIHHILACIGSCFGCCIKPTPIIAVDEPTKGLRIQGQKVKKPSISDDFWSSSTCDLDSAFQSQRSISSISTLNQVLKQDSGTSSTIDHPDFVNHGLLLWNQSRLQWTGSERSESQNQPSWTRHISWNTTYESVLDAKLPFRKPVPLSDMIEFLADEWEQEGLYD